MEATAAGDTVQAVTDTMVVVQQSDTVLDWLSFIGTALVALFTGGYLYYTYWIYQETQKHARSAETSAQASRKAAKASQESVEQQKRVNDATIEALEKRSVERAHPFLWANVDLTSDDGGKCVSVQFQNQSELPALEVSTHVFSSYNDYYYKWSDFQSEVVGDMRDHFRQDPTEYGFLTAIDIEAVESEKSPSLKLRYPTPPNSIKVFMQYRDIHGANYGRYFWATASYDTPEPDSMTPDSVISYDYRQTIPHSVKKINRIRHRKLSGSKGRLVLLREEDKTNRNLLDTGLGYRHSDDELLREVGELNRALENIVMTDALRSFDAEVEEQGLFSHSVSMPLS